MHVGLQIFIELRKELCPELFPRCILNNSTFILGINIHIYQYQFLKENTRSVGIC